MNTIFVAIICYSVHGIDFEHTVYVGISFETAYEMLFDNNIEFTKIEGLKIDFWEGGYKTYTEWI